MSLTRRSYLTVLPVQSVKGLEVFSQDPVWQVSILHLNICKDWQRPWSICPRCSNRETHLRCKPHKWTLAFKRRRRRRSRRGCCWPRNCWYCCSCAEMSHKAVACCWAKPPGVPLAIPWFFCTALILVEEAIDIHKHTCFLIPFAAMMGFCVQMCW